MVGSPQIGIRGITYLFIPTFSLSFDFFNSFPIFHYLIGGQVGLSKLDPLTYPYYLRRYYSIGNILPIEGISVSIYHGNLILIFVSIHYFFLKLFLSRYKYIFFCYPQYSIPTTSTTKSYRKLIHKLFRRQADSESL